LFCLAPSIEEQEIRFGFHGKTFLVKADHRTPLYETIAEVIDFDCYQLRLLGTSVRDGVVVDVGANIGVTALCMAHLGARRLLCLEPFPENRRYLLGNLAANGVETASVLDAALGPNDALGRLVVPDETVGCRLAREGEREGATLEVKTMSLQSVLQTAGGRVRLLKADCEGGEYSLVSQLDRGMAADVENLTFEVHDIDEERNLKSLAVRLKSLGYALSYRPDLFRRPTLHHVFATRSREVADSAAFSRYEPR
jgi:FkbM family methyltransferase